MSWIKFFLLKFVKMKCEVEKIKTDLLIFFLSYFKMVKEIDSAFL